MTGGSIAEIRSATPQDLAGMARIYNDAVRHTVATFDVEPRPDDHYAGHLASTRPGDHVLVAVDAAGLVLGYAFSGTYRPRAAYGGTREVSVYLADGTRGQGLGRRLYDELLARVDADGIHTCLAVIAQPNPASEALHRACGFEPVGTLREVGRKFDAWVDTAFWQRLRPDA
ncbi:N-acetyltransferase family protein [Phycicoccus avicenniae]|uniref:GNAT family N-acetyltransferase n=1 Tax=Phycicoccus avicenniae TaxID=2828860 RepID=UPI003D2A25D0